MADTRSIQELEAIKAACKSNGIDPETLLSDPSCDLTETARRLRVMRAVRQCLQPHIWR